MMTPAKPPEACDDHQLMEIECCKENTGEVRDLPF